MMNTYQLPNLVNTYQVLIISCVIFILSGHTVYDEPHITEKVFFSCVSGYEFPFYSPLEFVFMKELKKHEVFDEIVDSLGPPRVVIDRLHYVMYKIGKKENELQIFYQCLKETQDRDSGHIDTTEILKKKGEPKVFYYI